MTDILEDLAKLQKMESELEHRLDFPYLDYKDDNQMAEVGRLLFDIEDMKRYLDAEYGPSNNIPF